MKIRVYAPAFCDYKYIDDNGFMELDEGTTLSQVLKKLNIPLVFRKVLISTVNYQKEKLSYKIKEGDIISIIGPLSGG